MIKKSESVSYVIIADCAMDWIIRPTESHYLELSGALVQEEEQELKHPHKDPEWRAKTLLRKVQSLHVPYKRHFGGPIFNLAQYLQAARKQNVSVVSVIGDNEDSKRYVQALEDIGVNTKYLHQRKGPMPVCLYVHHSSEHQLPRIWRGNVSQEGYLPQSPLYSDFLNKHDVLVLGVANPRVAVASVKMFDGRVAYNPGPYLKFFPFEQTRFTDIIPKTDILSVNKEEKYAVEMGLRLRHITELFPRHERLEYIITTLGNEGSEIHKRNGQSYRYDPADDSLPLDPERIVDDIGAGDAYFATALHYIMKGMDVSDVVMAATRAAQQSLLHAGGVDHRFLKEDATPYPSVKKVGNGH